MFFFFYILLFQSWIEKIECGKSTTGSERILDLEQKGTLDLNTFIESKCQQLTEFGKKLNESDESTELLKVVDEILNKINECTPNVPEKSDEKEKVSTLTDELAIKNSKIMEQQNCIHILESTLREKSNMAELEQLLTVVKSKDDRINELEQLLKASNITYEVNVLKDERILELENALKESLLVAAEREKVFYKEEQERICLVEKVILIKVK